MDTICLHNIYWPTLLPFAAAANVSHNALFKRLLRTCPKWSGLFVFREEYSTVITPMRRPWPALLSCTVPSAWISVQHQSCSWCNGLQVQEPFYHINVGCYSWLLVVSDEPATDFLCAVCLRSFLLSEKGNTRPVSNVPQIFSLFLHFVNHLFQGLLTVECFQSTNNDAAKFIFYLHKRLFQKQR